MNFSGYKKWLNEGQGEGITVLFPSSVKPMHGGHLDLIKKYASHPDVKEVRVLIGPGVRNGVDQKKAYNIAQRLTEDIPNVVLEAVNWPSPVLTAYKIIEDAEPGTYALAASKKGDDYKRVQDFVWKHGPDGKYIPPEGVEVVELSLDAEPMNFIGRDDEYEGKPISASVLRDDIVNDDLENFSAGYPDTDPEDIDFVWKELAEIVMNEAMYTSGTPTISSPNNYDRAKQGYYYKSMFPILEDGEEEDISEGGGAGHLMSPWEAKDLTFGEVRDLINKALEGKLENVTEKLDGQNLMITVKDGDVYLAKTQKQMRNGGELAVRWDGVKNSMREEAPDFVKKAFQEAADDLQTVFRNSKLDLNKIFKDGHCWLNIELLNPETENIVPYGEFQLRIHNMREVDDSGGEVDVVFEGGDLDKIIEDIELSQASGDLDKIHLISKTNRVNFEKIKDLENIKEGIIRALQSVIMDPNHLDDDNTIGDYLAQEIRTWLDGVEEVREDKELIEALIQRWAYGNKSTNITKLLKEKDEDVIKLVKYYDKEIDNKIGELLDPIIEIFSRVGIAVLQNLSGIAASNPDIVSQGIRKKSEDAIRKITEFVARKDVKDIEDFDKKVKYLETQLRRIEQSGGLEGIAPLEGIVFEYKGKLFKLQGNYLPILKMINFFQFGKDK